VRELWGASRPILRSRNLWALALSFIGLWTVFYVAAQYFVQYAHSVHPSWSLGVAAGLPTLMIALEIVGGPLGGWLGERRLDMRWILAGFGGCAAAEIFLIPFASLLDLVPLFLLLGVLAGATFAILYLLPTYLPETSVEGLSLALALVNAIQIFVGSGLAVAFAYIATYDGYTYAWFFAGAVGLATLPLLYFVTGHRPQSSPANPIGGSVLPPPRTDRPV